MKYSTIESEYLVSLIRSVINGEPVKPAPEELDIEKLHTLAKKQQVDSLVFSALADNGIITGEQLSLWKTVYLNEMQKLVVVNAERESICAQLENEGIDYMFLKGLVVREYYPKMSMRQMSDNDLLYDESKRDSLIKIMRANGYYLGAAAGYGDDFYKEPYSTFEFHRTLFSDQDAFHPNFSPWKNARRVGSTHRLEMSSEDNYIYTLCHMYKHYSCNRGCGVRFLCDIHLIIENNSDLDFTYIDKTLKKFGVLDFSNTVRALAQTVFKNGKENEKQQEVIDVMFSGGVFGAGIDRVSEELKSLGGSKFKYLLKRIFPSRSMMIASYKALEKRRYLLPFYYVYRIIEKWYHHRKLLKRELAQLRQYKKEND